MLGTAKEIIKETRLLGAEVGSDITLILLTLAFTAFVIFIMIRQNNKQSERLIEQNKTHNKLMKEELVSVKEDQQGCHKDRERLEVALIASERRGEEINNINKEAQRRIQEAEIAQRTMIKMFEETFTKVMNKD